MSIGCKDAGLGRPVSAHTRSMCQARHRCHGIFVLPCTGHCKVVDGAAVCSIMSGGQHAAQSLEQDLTFPCLQRAQSTCFSNSEQHYVKRKLISHALTVC